MIKLGYLAGHADGRIEIWSESKPLLSPDTYFFIFTECEAYRNL